MLLDTLGASLFGNILAGKGTNRCGEGVMRAGYGKKTRLWKRDVFSVLPHLLTNFEIQKYYQNEHRFSGVYSRHNLPRIKEEAYVINLDEYHWIALYEQNNDVTYFDSFGVEHIPKEIRTFISNKNIKANIFRIQAYNSIMCGYFCIRLINFMLAGTTLTDFTNLFSPNNF